MFSTVRIRSVQPTTDYFARPADFDISNYLGNSFRAVRGDADQSWDVVLKFLPEMADRIQEKVWHHTQQLEHQRDGSLQMKLQVSSLVEIRRWVMFWGADCEVIGPEELRAIVIQELRGMLILKEPTFDH